MVDENPAHFNALRFLIKLEFRLNRSSKTIQNYINRLIKFLPEDAECLEWQNRIQTLEAVDSTPPSSIPAETKPENNVPIQKPEPNTEKNYKSREE